MTDYSSSAAGEPTADLAPAALRIAVLDRDSGFLAVLGKRLERVGWEQRVLGSTVTPDAIAAMRLNALVVDLAVLGPPCWDWLGRLCNALPELGIIVCTGSSTVAQRVRGLRVGADDWLSKPCHPEELIARVEAVVRRRRRMEPTRDLTPISAGEVEIRSDQYQAFVGGQGIDLTRREFELIELLAGSDGRVLEREFIYQRLWGYSMVRGDRSRCARSSSAPRRAGAISTPTSASATASRPSASRLAYRTTVAYPTPASSSISPGRSRRSRSPWGKRTTAMPPFFSSIRAPVRSYTTCEKSGS
jgi:DNA-binding response OmpR family regulator